MVKIQFASWSGTVSASGRKKNFSSIQFNSTRQLVRERLGLREEEELLFEADMEEFDEELNRQKEREQQEVNI